MPVKLFSDISNSQHRQRLDEYLLKRSEIGFIQFLDNGCNDQTLERGNELFA